MPEFDSELEPPTNSSGPRDLRFFGWQMLITIGYIFLRHWPDTGAAVASLLIIESFKLSNDCWPYTMDCWLNLCICSGLGMVDSGDQLPADSPFAQCLSSQAQAVGTPSLFIFFGRGIQLNIAFSNSEGKKTLLQNASSALKRYPLVILNHQFFEMKTPRWPTSSAAPASAGEWPL